MELRCDSKRLFAIVEDETIEVTCRSRRCGYDRGIVVLHRFSVLTGELIDTKRYRNARRETT